MLSERSMLMNACFPLPVFPIKLCVKQTINVKQCLDQGEMSPLPSRLLKYHGAVGQNGAMQTEPSAAVMTRGLYVQNAPGQRPLGGAVASQVNMMSTMASTVPLSGVMMLTNPLAQCLPEWEECRAHPWVLSTITKGYKLQFAVEPPTFERVIFSQASGQAATVLRDEIFSLLGKNAIREVPLDQSRNGFYSKYFLVKKKGGGMRPILDLRSLNKYLKRFRFKMLTNAALLRMMRRGDWYATIDLKDAFFHIPIYPPHRKFLRFGFEGRVYEFTVLPFGMSLSPRVFVKCTQAAIAPLRSRGVRIATYIDDWAIFGDSRQQAERHVNLVVSHLTSLGFTVNYEKSVLSPTRTINFLGMTLDSTSFTARLSEDRVNSIMACAATFRVGHKVPFRTCMKMAGLMASALYVIRLGRLYARPFQRWMQSLQVPYSRPHHLVMVRAECTLALLRWRDRCFLSEGVTMGLVTSRKVITTDASLTGWGATHEGRSARGVWDHSLRTAHINYLELMAVWLALQHFHSFIEGCHVLIRTDNTTTKCYINKQGGLRSHTLHLLARRLILWCDKHLASIRASHVPGLQNMGADLLSRGKCHYAEWSLHQAVVAQIWDRFGRPQADLFATEENTKCPLFYSITGAATLGLDALAHDWPEGLLYAFPPLSLIHPLLERVRTLGLSVILVAPGWGAWRSEITPLLCGRPWQLPLRRDLLSQARGEIFHPRPGDLDLWAWPVSG